MSLLRKLLSEHLLAVLPHLTLALAAAKALQDVQPSSVGKMTVAEIERFMGVVGAMCEEEVTR